MKLNIVGLRSFQKHLQYVYDKRNHQLFNNNDLFTHLLKRAALISKMARNRQSRKMEKNLVMAFAWAIAIANRYGIDILSEIQRRFPRACPYCASLPCACGDKRPPERAIISMRIHKPWMNISEGQKMFHQIYPQNTLDDSIRHLLEEVAEVAIAIMFHSGRHTISGLGDIHIELVDVFANIFAVATCAGIHLETALVAEFEHGCSWCHRMSCKCSFNGIVKSSEKGF